MRPAEITFAPSVNTVLIVDRTKFEKKAINVIEGILTGEGLKEDQAGVQAFMNSFHNQLNQSPRFSAKMARERLDGNSLTAAMPKQLAWSEVAKLCRQYQSDILLAIEVFDSDMIITDGKRVVEREVKTDSTTRVVKVDEFYAEGVANITIGIRLYDPETQDIVDQQLFKRTNTWNAAAASKAQALAQLINKGDANRYLSENLGSNYAFKIAPMAISIRRSFKGKAKKAPDLERGARQADVGNWAEAAKIWEYGLRQNPRDKEAGYLAYNIGLAHEVQGDLDKALEWAQKSYTQYGFKDGRNYASILRNRIQDEALLSEQMK
eukprot:gnl/TRDRNA2_/TRDRNA2_31786_c0_seq1.p1 gnl/TRDRNA2_/TRDRNA2_31786_c0~~gnl/TRDRNA2_/TRDRNA2_31786_c0_seq1.p1  ORF type:complete len:348 (-),score=13.61 gnl/TRDRNA2_/TRDRNA2_31786_c0_seq1:48-1013(-)